MNAPTRLVPKLAVAARPTVTEVPLRAVPLQWADFEDCRIAPGQLSLVQAVYGGMGVVDVFLQGLDYRLEWECPPGRCAIAWGIKLQTRQGEIKIGLDAEGLFPFWPVAEYPMPTELLTAHLVEEFAPLLDWLDTTFDAGVQSVQLYRAPAPIRPTLTLKIDCLSLQRRGWLHVLDLPGGFDLRRLRGNPFPAALREPWHAQWPVSVRFSLGRTAMGIGELRDLEPGDVLVIESWMARDDKLRLDGYLESGSTPSLVLWAGERLAKVANVIEEGEAVYTADRQPSGLATQAIDELEVVVSFNLSERRVKLGELQDMRPGYIFELESALNRAAIRVVVNGSVIAVGQLVAVGERLGVRIARLATDAREQLS